MSSVRVLTERISLVTVVAFLLTSSMAVVGASSASAVTPGYSLAIFAGTGAGGSPTPGPASDSGLEDPQGLAFDPNTGDLYIADFLNNVIEQVTPGGILSIYAGVIDTGGPPTPGPATSSDIDYPTGLAVDPNTGDLYFTDIGNNVVEQVTPGGTLSIYAGVVDTAGPPTPGPATSSELSPFGLAVDPNTGNLYIGDLQNNVVEQVTPGGILSIYAGVIDTVGPPKHGPATSSDLDDPDQLAFNPSTGDLYIDDFGNNVVEQVTPGGTLSIYAGTGTKGPPTPGTATSSDLTPFGLAVDPSTGDLYIADGDGNVIEQVTPDGTLSIVAGNGETGPPTRGLATSSDLGDLAGLAIDPNTGDLYITDVSNNVVEEVSPMALGTAPAFTSDTPPSTATVGSPYGPFTFGASGNPAPTYSVSSGSLPNGLSLDPTSGDLSGVPASSGTFTFGVTASNGVGPDAVTGTLTIAVSGPPTSTSATASSTSNPSVPATTSDAGVTATASDGTGTVVVSQYNSQPPSTLTPTFTPSSASGSNGTYYDVEATPGSTFSQMVVDNCVPQDVTAEYWYNPTGGAGGNGAWEPVVGDPGPTLTASAACDAVQNNMEVTFDTNSSPTLSQLTGTIFALAISTAQNITFTSTVPTNATYGGTYTVAATGGGSGNAVTFSAAALSVCTVAGSTVTFTGVGTCTIDANQAGEGSYLAAPQVSQGVIVGKAGTKLTADSISVLTSILSLRVTFTATLTSTTTSKGVAGQAVTFTDGSLVACSGVTNANGVASCSVSVLDVLVLLLSPSYSVGYAGESDYGSSSTTGKSTLL